MIQIDALYLLLLIECVAGLAAAVVYFVLRSRRYAALYRSVESGPQGVRGAAQEPPKQQAAAPSPALEQGGHSAEIPASGTAKKELEDCKTRVSALEEQVKEKTDLLNGLQVKFDDLEKEYLILYHQQQAQEQKKD